MAKERILSSIEFDLQAHTINVKWVDRFIEDGELINERPHRGAYPVDANNEVDDSVKTLLGASLQDIIGEQCANAQRRVGELLATIAAKDVAVLQGLEEAEGNRKKMEELTNTYGQLLAAANARIAELEASHAGTE